MSRKHPFKLQIGGHLDQILVDEQTEKYVYKIANQVEREFYETCSKEHLDLYAFIPRIYEVSNESESKYPLKLENLVHGYEAPCICDTKIGQRLHDDFENESKIIRLQTKNLQSTSTSLGIRITGLKCYFNDSKLNWCLTREEGYQLDTNGLEDTLRKFICSDDLKRYFTDRLQALIKVIEKLNCRIYSSSILLVYDASTDKRDLRLIDFAHSRFASTQLEHCGYDYSSPDLNLLFGLSRLVEIISRL